MGDQERPRRRAVRRISQPEFTPIGADKINELKRKTRTNTSKEILNEAFASFDWIVREIEEGRIIVSVDPKNGQMKELKMKIFERITLRENNDPQNP